MEPNMNSQEEKSINNFRLFIALLKNKDLPYIENILASGADVNATDTNDNTPMHISTRKCRIDIINVLLSKGACALKRNKEGDRPIDIAKTMDNQIGKEIVKILEASTTAQEASMISTQLAVSAQNNKRESSKNMKKSKKILFLKRPGTSGVSGQLYETKLLSLVFLRAMSDKDIEEFYLATNIRGIGALDDLCCRYRLKGHQKSVVMFLQAKHRDDPDKGRVTANDLRSAAGDFHLPKYFDSFLSIITKFSPNNKDPMFRDDIKNVELNFVIYTPAKESFEPKLVVENLQSDKIDKMINTSPKGVKFQFKYTDNDLDFLTRAIQVDRVKQLGHNFLEFVMSEKNKLQVIMTDELIRKFHVVFAQKVVSVSPNILEKEYRLGKFRPEFLKTYDRTLIALRDMLFKETVENHCKKYDLTKEEIIMYLQQLQEDSSNYALSKLLGGVVTYDERHNRLELVESNVLKKYFNADEINNIKDNVRNIKVSTILIHEAVQMAGESKLASIEFKLPISFGNVDLTIREDKLNKRLDFIVKVMQDLLIKNKEKKIIEIDDSCVGQKTEKDKDKLEPGIFDISGGIGGAVGTLLVYDETTKKLRFNTNTYLPLNARLFLEKLKTVIPEGENLADYRLDIKLKSFPRTSFSDVEDDKLAKQFLSRLWFYTNEAKEDAVEAILKKELDKYYNACRGKDHFVFRIHSDAIYLKFHDEIQKWWMLSSDAPYLTNESELLDAAKKDVIDSPLVTVLNHMYINKIKKTGVEFGDKTVTALNLDRYQNGIVNIITQANILSGIKIKQYYENCKNYAFISFDYVLGLPINDYNTMLAELRDTKLDTLIIMYELRKTMMGLSEKLKLIINKFNGNKIIIVTKPTLANEIRLHYPNNYHAVLDETNNLVNFTEKYENKFLQDTEVIFQGEKTNLNTIIDKKSKALLNAKILRRMINKEKIELGNIVANVKYQDIKDYYTDRHIKRGGEKYLVKSLEDIDQQVVVITAQPHKGKSTLLTHLAVETKNKDPSLWIVRIDFLDYIENFNKWHINRIKIDKIQCLKLLCRASLKGVDSKTIFNLFETNNEIKLASSEGLRSSTVLELELFLYYYNSKKLSFIFYGFDYVCPPYEKEVVTMLKIIEADGIRIWISSSSNITSKNALERAFGTVYTLEPINEIGQKSFFHKFWKTNLQLEQLNYEQFSNISDFLEYMAGLKDLDEHERRLIPWISMPLHMLYILAIEFFQSELSSVTPVTIREKIKQHFDLDLGNVTTLGKYLEKTPEAEQALELAGTPLHMYIAANYFQIKIKERMKIIVNSNEIKKKWDIFINTVSLYQRFLYSNLNNIFYGGNPKIDVSIEDDKRKQFIEKHKKLALFAICKEDDLKHLLPEDEINEMKNMMSRIQTGAEKSPLFDCVLNDAPKFFHFLFAEYSAVEYLTELLKATSHDGVGNILKHRALWDFLVNVFLMTCPKSVRNAFDYKLKNDPELAEMITNENSQKIVFELLLKQRKEQHRDSSRETTLDFALHEGMVNFVNILLKCIEVNLNKHNVGDFVEIVKRSAFLLSSFDSKYGNVAKQVMNIINNIDKDRVLELLNSNEIINVPVGIVSLCGNAAVVDNVRENLTAARDHLIRNSDNLFGLNVDMVNLIQDVCNAFQHPRSDN